MNHAGPWPAGDPDDAVRAILRGPAYAQAAPTTDVPPNDPWHAVHVFLDQYIWKPLQHLFDSIGHALHGGETFGEVLGFAIDAVVVVLIVLVIVRAVMAISKTRSKAFVRSEMLIDLAGRATDWRARAKEAAGRGEYASAIAALFRAALATLDARAVVGFDGARTPGEYRRLVRRARPEGAPPFDDLANGFVRATYAEEPPARADFEAAERALAALEPALEA